MSKKMFHLISLLLIAAFVLAACQPAATATPAAATKAPAATSAPAATTAPKATKITIWYQWDDTYLPAIKEAFKAYETSHPGVTIELSKPEKVTEALAVAIPAGQGPDIIAWANDAIGEQAIKGNIVPLNDYKVDDAFLKGIYTSAGIAGVTYKGKIWGLPETMEGIALVANKAVWKDSYAPKDMNDWDGLLKAAEQFQKDNPGKTLFCNQGFPGGDAYHIAPVFFGNGVPSYVDENGKVYLNTPEAIKAMTWLQNVSKFLAKEQTDDICRAALKEGKTAAQWTGPWAIKGFEDAKIDYTIIPMGKPFVGIKTVLLTKNAVDRKNAEVAVDIMKYYTSADVQKKIALTNKVIPAQTAALNDPEVAKLTAVAGFGKALATGIPMSNSPYASAQWGPVGDAVKVIWTAAQKPEDALKAAQGLVEKAISEMK